MSSRAHRLQPSLQECVHLIYAQFPLSASELGHLQLCQHISKVLADPCSCSDHLLPPAFTHLIRQKEQKFNQFNTCSFLKQLLLQDHFFSDTTNYKATFWHEFFQFLSALFHLLNTLFPVWLYDWKSLSGYWKKPRAANSTSELKSILVCSALFSSNQWISHTSDNIALYPHTQRDVSK